jgi:DNA-binding NarL/FixJ family response regulator
MIRVVIVEDQPDIREGLASLIDGTDGYSVSGRFASMEEAVVRIRPKDADVALIDLGLPGMSGIEGIRQLKQTHPDLLLLVLTVYHDDNRIFEALCAGAAGYLLKKTAPQRLLESIQEVVDGGSPMSPEVARRVVALFRQIRPAEHADHNLTPHEIRLLKLLMDGHTYRSAAAQLGITTHTISFHLRQIYSKLQVHSKSEAVARAMRAGVIR